MKTISHSLATIALGALVLTSCGGDDPTRAPDAGTGPKTFKQVEQLARPGINEALLISHPFLAGYNATAPSFAGVPTDVLNQVVGEAKTVLSALYLGGCLLNGALGLSAAQGVKPAGMTCHAVGPAIWEENSLAGVTLTQASKDAMKAYADKVFDQFEPDVMRVDVTVDSNYLTLCGDANSKPLLCGGRFLNNDVIDVTYNYLLNGAGTTKGAYDQVRALTSDGVVFSTDDNNNVDSVVLADPRNPQQFHPNVSPGFPYSAKPF
jgi:uncharacterized protein DUF4331